MLKGSIMTSRRLSRTSSRRRDNFAEGGRASAREAAANAEAQDNVDPIEGAVALWQQHSPRNLTREDGREIIENMTGFFRLLQEWDRADRARAGRTAPHP